MPSPAISADKVAVEPGLDNTIQPTYPAFQTGEATGLSHGKICYLDSAGKAFLAKTDVLATANGRYLCLSTGALDSWLEFALPGSLVNLGAASLTKGIAYFIDDSTGGIMSEYADLGAGAQIAFCGIAVSTSVLHFLPGFAGKVK